MLHQLPSIKEAKVAGRGDQSKDRNQSHNTVKE